MSAPANIRRSAGKDDWETPWPIIEAIKRDFGVTFDLDACASAANRKADRWLEGPCTWEDEVADESPRCQCGLCGDHGASTVFCNPPYSSTEDWLRSARLKTERGATEWCLIPVATGSSWWAPTVTQAADEIIFLNQRIPFIHPPRCDCKACTEGRKGSNTTDSAIVVFRPYNRARISNAGARSFSWSWRASAKQ